MARLHDAVIAAVAAEGGPVLLLQMVVDGAGIEAVYHGAVDTGIRFALARPELARRFIDEFATEMPDVAGDPSLSFGATALVEQVSKWDT